jgi:translation elongation factor EF-1beta
MADVVVFRQVSPHCNKRVLDLPHLNRWLNHMASPSGATMRQKVLAGEGKHRDDDDETKQEAEEEEGGEAEGTIDFDRLLDEPDSAELLALIQKKKAEAAAAAKSSKKAAAPTPPGRSNVILDVKPEDDATDLASLEFRVRAIAKEGLHWAAAQHEAVAYGLKKLRIVAIVHDDLVSVDELQEEIEKLPGVQSTDVHAFNKV